jgi:hypothetical protein
VIEQLFDVEDGPADVDPMLGKRTLNGVDAPAREDERDRKSLSDNICSSRKD